MTITDNHTNGTTAFMDIVEGEVFFSPKTEEVYMKCAYCGEDYNAINLYNGRLVYFGRYEEIEKVNAQLTITNL